MAQDVADFLEEKRKERQMNKTAFAKFLGMTQSNYSRMIAHRSGITSRTQQTITEALGLDREDLLRFKKAVAVSGGKRPDRNLDFNSEELEYLSRIAQVSGSLSIQLMIQHIKLYRSRKS